MSIIARRTQSNVELQPVGQVRVQEQDVSSGFNALARGLGDVGNVVTNEAIRRKVEDDDAAVFDAFNSAQEGAEVRFNGENGFNLAQGKDSFNSMADATEYLQSSKEQVSAMLGNDSQREKFAALMDKSNAGRISGLNRHIENERIKYNDNVLSTTISQEYNRAVNNPGDEEIRQDAIFNAELALQQKFKGQSQAFIQDKLQLLREGMNQEILLQLVETDFEQAEDYLNANYDDVSTAVKNNIEGKIKKKRFDLKAFVKTDEIAGKYADEGQALLAAQKIKDPELRKQVTSNLTNQYANQRRVDTQRKTKAVNQDWIDLMQWHDQGEVNGVNKVINEQENAKVKLAMKNYVSTLNNGKAPQTVPGTYSEALDVARNTPDELQLFIDENKDKLSIGDYKKFADIADDNLDNKDKNLKSAITENQQIKSILGEHKFDTSSKASANEITEYNNFMLQYEQSKNDWSKANGDREPNFTERDTIVRRLLAEHIIETGFFSDDTARFFELTDEQKSPVVIQEQNANFYNLSASGLMKLTPTQLGSLNTTGVNIGVMTPDQLNSLTKVLQRQGMPVTDENLKALYITYLKGRSR